MSLNDKEPMGLSGSPKTMFILGLAVGIGGMAVLALLFMVSVMFGGNGGSLLAKNTNTGNSGAAAAPSPTPSAAAAPTPSPSSPPPEVDGDDHVRGNPDAKVTLIEYSDFECPFCLRHVATLDQLLEDYPNDVRLIYRHFPLSFHPQAQKAAEASECAGAQGKFWEMHDAIFEANAAGTMSVATWKQVAGELGLNQSEFDNCLDSGEMAAKVGQDLQEGSIAGVGGTPGTFVNGQLVEGAVPYATFQQIVESEGASN